MTPRRSAIPLFAEDPDLLEQIPANAQARVRGTFFAEGISVVSGSWAPAFLPSEKVLGLIVVSGLLAREVTIDGTRGAELLGPRDVLTQIDDLGASVERHTDYRVIVATELAILDERFIGLAARAPGLFQELLMRTGKRAHCLATQMAVANVRPLPRRVLLILWQLADRWGIRRTSDVVIPAPLTHEVLAKLTCVGRPALTRALGTLTAAGEISRGDDRSWVLHGDPPPTGLADELPDSELVAA